MQRWGRAGAERQRWSQGGASAVGPERSVIVGASRSGASSLEQSRKGVPSSEQAISGSSDPTRADLDALRRRLLHPSFTYPAPAGLILTGGLRYRFYFAFEQSSHLFEATMHPSL